MTANQTGAEIRVDGRIAGTTPARVDGISTGLHVVEVRAGSATAAAQTVTVRAGDLVTLSFALVAPTGSPAVEVQPRAPRADPMVGVTAMPVSPTPAPRDEQAARPAPSGADSVTPEGPREDDPTRPDVIYRGGPLPPDAELRPRSGTALTIAGTVICGAAYIGQIVFGATYPPLGAGDVLPLAFIPVAGPALWPLAVSSSNVTSLFLIGSLPVLVVEAVGISLLIVGLTTQGRVVHFTRPVRYGEVDRTPHWTLLPGASGTPLGASVAITTF